MASVVWATAATKIHETHLVRLLEETGRPAQVIEVRLLKEWPADWASQTRKWTALSDLSKIAKEISKFIADSGAADVRIFVSDVA